MNAAGGELAPRPAPIPPPEPGTTRLKLTVAYDGRPFAGWQSQPGGQTVQDKLEHAFATLVGRRVIVQGAGRTDAGVHALGQVAHADVPTTRLPLKQWAQALNAYLPDEVRVMRAQPVPHEFHSRFSATGKLYHYRLWLAGPLHPLEIGRCWHTPGPLDFDRLQHFAQALTGTHDFAGFAANRGQPESSTVRTIWSIRLEREGSLLTLKFHGEGFLYRMVRLLTGSLVRLARGREEMPWLEEILQGQGKIKTRYSCPAEGLYLARVFYQPQPNLRSG